MDIAAIAALAPVIPVLTIGTAAEAVPLARALVKGGLPVLEVTLRTPVALEALATIAAEVEGAVVGAGTVLEPRQVDAIVAAGARFAVSPGFSLTVSGVMREAGLPFLPGIQTVSESLAAAEQGWRVQKFFPADVAGGPGWLKAVAAPLAGIGFCPTGGVGLATAPAYLALPNVVCVGGSWVAPRDAIASGNWSQIERLAAAAAALKRS
jgi:2-dehydro-3-deoxyphosphogluconate aldolase/(4S)-4-hydroxy-2-oxoglutarate aldolase